MCEIPVIVKNSAATPWMGVTGNSMLPVLISHLSTTDLSWVLQWVIPEKTHTPMTKGMLENLMGVGGGG